MKMQQSLHGNSSCAAAYYRHCAKANQTIKPIDPNRESATTVIDSSQNFGGHCVARTGHKRPLLATNSCS
jgi:hypothetical protein